MRSELTGKSEWEKAGDQIEVRIKGLLRDMVKADAGGALATCFNALPERSLEGHVRHDDPANCFRVNLAYDDCPPSLRITPNPAKLGEMFTRNLSSIERPIFPVDDEERKAVYDDAVRIANHVQGMLHGAILAQSRGTSIPKNYTDGLTFSSLEDLGKAVNSMTSDKNKKIDLSGITTNVALG